MYELHRNLYKNCSFFVTVEQLSTSKISSTCPTGWIIYQNMRETWEKKVMKFEREIPIGLDAQQKKRQGGGGLKKPTPPMGLGLTKGFVTREFPLKAITHCLQCLRYIFIIYQIKSYSGWFRTRNFLKFPCNFLFCSPSKCEMKVS